MFLKTTEEERAAKQSEVTLLMDEVERAQTMLLSLEREKVQSTNFYFNNLIVKCDFFVFVFTCLIKILLLSLYLVLEVMK